MRWGNNAEDLAQRVEQLEQRVVALETALKKIVHILADPGSPMASRMKTTLGDAHEDLLAFMPDERYRLASVMPSQKPNA